MTTEAEAPCGCTEDETEERPAYRAGAALGLREDDPSLVKPADEPFAPDLRHPPREWFFEKPDWFSDDTKIWVDSDGRAAGWYYHAGTCLIGSNDEECWMPQPSPTGNEIFHQGSLVTAEGDVLDVGVIGGGGDHAPTWMGVEQAAAYYADVDKQVLVGRVYDEPGVGSYFLGAVLPEVTTGQVDKVRRSALSGDWRWRKFDSKGRPLNAYDALGPWLVSRPGLPLNRAGFAVTQLASAASPDHPVMVSAVAAVEEEAIAYDEDEATLAVEAVFARADRLLDRVAELERATADVIANAVPLQAVTAGSNPPRTAAQPRDWHGRFASKSGGGKGGKGKADAAKGGGKKSRKTKKPKRQETPEQRQERKRRNARLAQTVAILGFAGLTAGAYAVGGAPSAHSRAMSNGVARRLSPQSSSFNAQTAFNNAYGYPNLSFNSKSYTN